jgi:hypothetical protein
MLPRYFDATLNNAELKARKEVTQAMPGSENKQSKNS